MARTIRVGLLGFGLGGRVFHAPLIAATPGLELSAIVTGNPDRQAAARAACRTRGSCRRSTRCWRPARSIWWWSPRRTRSTSRRPAP